MRVGLVMWAARRHTGLTLRQTGAALGGIDYAAVSMAVQRLEARARHDRAVANLQQQVAKLLNVEMSPEWCLVKP